MTTTEIAGIIAKLTKAQKHVVECASDEWRFVTETHGLGNKSWQAIYNAERMKVIDIRPYQIRLTPLGTAVRAALQEAGE